MPLDPYKTWTLREIADNLGPSLAAVGCGLDETATLNSWLEGAQMPAEHQRQALLLGRCCGVLSQKLSNEQVQHWLLANNPELDDDPAIFLLAKGRGLDAVRAAVRFCS